MHPRVLKPLPSSQNCLHKIINGRKEEEKEEKEGRKKNSLQEKNIVETHLVPKANRFLRSNSLPNNPLPV